MGPKWRNRFPWGRVWGAALLLGGAGGGYAAWQAGQAAAARLPAGVQTAIAARGDLEQKITATGVAAAQTGAKVNIGSQISGRIRSLPADVGTVVRAGQVVAVLDAPDLQAQVEQQRQSVSAAAAGLRQAESRLRQSLLSATLTREQTRAQIEEADQAALGAEQRLQAAAALNRLQPAQTEAEIARTEAGLSTARAQEQQVKQTVRLQLQQSQTAVDELRAGAENAHLLLRRQQALASQGYVARQEVDNAQTAHRQALARQQSAEAGLSITREKVEADLQAARNRMLEAEAARAVARAGLLQNTVREAEEQSARAGRRQADAVLALRRSNRTQDQIRARAVEESQAAVAQARATLRQTRALLRFQEAQLDKTVIRAPIDGTVLSITAQQGETIAAGFSAPTLITVADLSRLEVRAYVDEVDVGRARLGLPAEVRVESFPNRVFHGRVTKIAAASTIKDNVVTYETTVAVRDAGGLLRPDMTADVTLVLGRVPDVLRLPTESVHRAVSRSVVYVLHRDRRGKKRVEEREVRTGSRDASHVQVLSGLREGEEVVLAGLQRLDVKAVDAQDAEGRKER